MQPQPQISVVIPTHNRRESLRRTMEALCAQAFPAERLELVVVADGCADGTAAMARALPAPFALRVVEQPAGGAAAARNRGAAEARGALLLFLDDDILPAPGLVAAHVRAHAAGGAVVVGPYPPPFRRGGMLQRAQDAWWSERFARLCAPGHRFSYQDVLSGNLSLPAGLFAAVGGFDADPAFAAHEDYELGIRLMRAGARLGCAPDALAHHHDAVELDAALRRKRQEGRADARLARRHPELIASLPLAHISPADPLAARILRLGSFWAPAAAPPLDAVLRRALAACERLRLRRRWARLSYALQRLWYWRGVADELRSRPVWGELLRQGKAALDGPHPTSALDLRDGLEAAEAQLDRERPLAARVSYGGRAVGLIPFQPGAEPLRGAHLRPALAETLAAPLLAALVAAGVCPAADAGPAADAITAARPWLGPLAPGQVWLEQYAQWGRLERELAAGPPNPPPHPALIAGPAGPAAYEEHS